MFLFKQRNLISRRGAQYMPPCHVVVYICVYTDTIVLKKLNFSQNKLKIYEIKIYT